MKIQKIIALGMVLAIFTACQTVSKPELKMSEKQGLIDIKELLIEKVGENTEFVTFNIISNNYLDCLMEVASFENKDNHINYIFMTDQIVKIETSLKGKYLNLKPFKLKDLDIEAVVRYMEKAKDLIHEQTDDFFDFKIRDILFNTSLEGEQYCLLEIVAQKTDASPTKYGNRIEPGKPYFTFRFKANIQTEEVTCVDGLDN